MKAYRHKHKNGEFPQVLSSKQGDVLKAEFSEACLIYFENTQKKCGVVILDKKWTIGKIEPHLQMMADYLEIPIKDVQFKLVGPKTLIDVLVLKFKEFEAKIVNQVVRDGEITALVYFNECRIRLEKSEVSASPESIKQENPIQNQSASPTVSVTNVKKKILIVDDSSTIRTLLKSVFSEDPELEVVAMAEKPSEVEGLIKKHKPDVITLDIHMPEMDGVTLLKKLMPLYKIPTVMISSISKEEGPQVLEALENGAVDYIQKPSLKDLDKLKQNIVDRIKAAAYSKVISKAISKPVKKYNHCHLDSSHLIVIGSSTGGTEALKTVLTALPNEIPPILIVQHIPAVFSLAFANRLNDICSFTVKEAADGDLVRPNQVLIAPGGLQMGVKVVGKDLKVYISDDPPVNRHKPSVDYLFNTVAELGLNKMVAAILTGMGADGAKGLLKLRNLGARTIAQDKETSVVWGMPREAAEMGAAEFVLPLEDVANKFVELTSKDSSSKNKAS